MSHKKRILLTGVLLASAVVSGLLIYTRANAVPVERVIHITAKNFRFNPDSITLKKGEPVVFEISSGDRKHGFSLRAFGLRSDVLPGQVSRIRFTPNKTGKFTFSCDLFCGDGHEEMTGTVIVN
ncbi:MAG: cytochrome c oxidase subunit [Blastocatellia bacterium]|jgi:cytochrome c oxidase subunit 2|nr:cytochrome c oxidase subunit [Blastocatellia bacterium]